MSPHLPRVLSCLAAVVALVGAGPLAAPASAAAHIGPAVEWPAYGLDVCAEHGGELVEFEIFRVRRDARVTSADLQRPEGDLRQVARALVTPVDPDQPTITGTAWGRAPEPEHREQLSWDQRRPLVGARLEPGRYYVFVRFAVDGPASHRGITLGWEDDAERTGLSVGNVAYRFRDRC